MPVVMNSGQCLKYLKVSLYVKYWNIVRIKKQPNKQKNPTKQLDISPCVAFN